MKHKQYLGDFSYHNNQMDGLSDSLSATWDKIVDKGEQAVQNAAVKATDQLLNDQIAKLLGTNSGGSTTTTSSGGISTTSVTLPGQTSTQYITQPMDMTTKLAIGGAVALLGIMTLAVVLKK